MVGIIKDVSFEIGVRPDTREDTGVMEIEFTKYDDTETTYLCFDDKSVAKDMRRCIRDCLKLEEIKDD